MKTDRFPLFLVAMASLILGLPRAAIADATSAPPPPLTSRQVFRGTFGTADGVFKAGTAFVIHHARSPTGLLLLTAHHLFGEAGGLRREVSGSELPRFVRKVVLTDMASSACGTAGPALSIADARASSEDDVSHDVAAFVAPAALRSRALSPARAAPQAGDRVWLFAEVRGGAPPGRLLHGATVVRSTATELVYRFDDAALALRATSGAPVVNAKGEVVGINLAGGPESGVLFGVANPIVSVEQLLRRSLR